MHRIKKLPNGNLNLITNLGFLKKFSSNAEKGTRFLKVFKLNKNLYMYQTSSTMDDPFCFPKIHTTTYGFKSIKYQGPFIWNKMMKLFLVQLVGLKMKMFQFEL